MPMPKAYGSRSRAGSAPRDARPGSSCAEDDGRGFRVGDLRDDSHYGLSMMREQAAVAGGIVRVSSAPGKGTTVEVVVPVS